MAEAESACVLCGARAPGAAIVAYDRSVGRAEDFRYRRCGGCGLLSLTPLPQAAGLAAWYPDHYGAHASPPVARGSQPRIRRVVNGFLERRLYAVEGSGGAFRGLARGAARTLSRFAMRGVLEPHGASRLLDVGCGSGTLLARHRALGWEVQGVEPREQGVLACRAAGIPVLQGGLLETELPDGHYDAVLLHHVVEHLLDPVAALARAASLLAPGGRVHVVTPNLRGLGFALYGTCWYALDAPRHLHLFTAATLRRLGERAGLETLRIATPGSLRVVCESRRCAKSQGRVLPPGREVRQGIVARSREAPERQRLFRALVRPLVSAAALAGRGDHLVAHFARPGERA